MKTKLFIILAATLLSLSQTELSADSYARFYMFVRHAANNRIYYMRTTEPGMGYEPGWSSIPNSEIMSDPAAVCKSEGRIDVFGRDATTGGLRHWYWDPDSWTTDSTDYG